MAASDKNKSGKRTDYAKHYSATTGGMPICKELNYGYSTSDKSDVDCKKCLNKFEHFN